MEVLEYSDITSENRGYMISGRLKMTDQNIVFKNSKTGKVEQINSADIDLVNFQRFVGSFGLRIFLKNGQLHRFMGFKSGEEEKVSSYFKKHYQQELPEKELSMRGWNWGTVNFSGTVLSLDCERKSSFEIPLNNVSQCTTGKNEVTLEFHQNDECPVSLIEMRFHIPTSESVDIDPVEAFHQNVMKQASVISVSGDAVAIFREIPCLTPRGRYDIKIFPTFFQLHGKTFDYKIPMSTVLRLFLLPHKDNRQMFFVTSLDPPIKQGQTRYHYLVFQFNNEDETTIDLPFTDEELKTKYENKLPKELSGPVYEVLGKIMKTLINRKLTGPGSFIGHSGTPAISASYKAAAGYIYPLERGFIYVHKPPLHIRFEEIASVNFARSGGSTRSFDFEIELKSGTLHTFSSIEKEEYGKLFDYVTGKKLNVKNTGKNDKSSYKDDFGDSDNEAEPDAYLARVKQEAEDRDSDGEDSDESTDEDFNPDIENVEDVADEFDSNVDTTSESEDGDSDDSAKKKRKEKKEKKKSRKERKDRGERKEGTKSKKKKDRDDNRPKRATTAFMVWLNEEREKIKADNPGIKVTEIAKKGGEMWRELKDKTPWEEKAAKDKERYTEEMKSYKPTDSGSGTKRKKNEASPKKPTTSVTMTGSGFKSKEYISDDDSSGESDKDAKKKQKTSDSKKKTDKKSKKKKDDDEEEEEEEEPSESEEEEDEDESDDASD